MAIDKYFGYWGDYTDMARDFFGCYGDTEEQVTTKLPSDFPARREILLAVYVQDGYDGSCYVVYRKDGKLYEVCGGHCSCYGLEDQWTPEETSKAALRMRIPNGRDYYFGGEDAAWERFVKLFGPRKRSA